MRWLVKIGYALAAVGCGVLSLLVLVALSLGRDEELGPPLRAWALLVGIAGVGLTCYAKAVIKFDAVNRPADQAYQDGYEAGYDHGWREGRASATLSVVHLDAESEAEDAVE